MKSNCSALKYLLVLGIAILGIAQLPAQTSFSGGNVATPSDWTNGLPSPDNDGTIAQAGTANNVFFNEASGVILLSHTEDTLTGTPNLQNTGAAPVQWTQSGGTFSANNFFIVNNRVTYELTGTGLINFASVTGGSRLLVVSADAALVQSGGTIDGVALAFENSSGTSTLSGGVGLNLGASWAGGGAIRVLNSTVQITGDYTATINSGFSNAAGLDNGVLSMEGTGVLDFSPTWTGSLTQTAFSGTTNWQDALTQTGVRVGGTQVTTENFGDYFAIVDDGVTVESVGIRAGETVFLGGNVATPTDWSNGLPSSENDGIIGLPGVANNVFFDEALGDIKVSHIEGTLTGTPNLQNTGAAPVQWTQSGGTFSATNFFVVNNRVTYELTGTGLINFASVTGGSRLQVVGAGGALLQSGGTIDGVALAFENTTGISNLSGGVGLNLGASWAGGGAIRVLNSTVNITGDYTATINSGFSNGAGLSSGVLSMEGTGVLDFSPTWTGSLSQTAFNGTTNWQDALTQTGVRVGGTQVTTENFGDYFAIVDNGVTVVSVGTSVTAGTRFIGSNVATPTHWTNGLPSSGNDGTIAQAGTANNVFFNEASGAILLSHIEGRLTGTPNLQNTGAAPVQWTQSGGTFSANNFFIVNNRVTYELTGTGLINFASVIGGSRLQVVNAGGAFLQSGGTIDGVALAFENTTGISNLSGGVGLNLGASWAGGGAIRVLNSTVQITGDYTATINSGFSNAAGLSSGVLSMEGTGVLDFSPTWTGSLSQTAFSGTTKWQAALTQTGVRVGGTQVTTENFDDYFSVVDNGVTVITRPPDTLWTGATNNVWDINSTSNWISDGSPVNYIEGGIVIFDDSASTTTVTLDAIVKPSIVEFNNATKNYTLGGTGSIAGITGLTKSGAATLTLANTNTYIGNTTILAGTLTLTGQISSGAGAVSMRDDTSLNVTANGNNPAISNTGAMFVGTDYLNPAGMNTITFDGLSSLSVAPISVGSLLLDSPVTVNIAGVSPVVGQYPLFQYTSEYEVYALSLGSLPDGFTATLVDDIESKSIYLDVTAAPSSGAPFDAWAASFGIVGNEALPEADPDNDGLSNLLEFVLGGNPTSGAQASVGPKVQTTANDLILTFNRSSASKLQPVGLKVQISGDLNTWDPADDIVIGATSGSSYTVTEMDGYDLIVVTISKSGPTKFARVTAELPDDR